MESLYDRTKAAANKLNEIPGIIDSDSPQEHQALDSAYRALDKELGERFAGRLEQYSEGLIGAHELVSLLVELALEP